MGAEQRGQTSPLSDVCAARTIAGDRELEPRTGVKEVTKQGSQPELCLMYLHGCLSNPTATAQHCQFNADGIILCTNY